MYVNSLNSYILQPKSSINHITYVIITYLASQPSIWPHSEHTELSITEFNQLMSTKKSIFASWINDLLFDLPSQDNIDQNKFHFAVARRTEVRKQQSSCSKPAKAPGPGPGPWGPCGPLGLPMARWQRLTARFQRVRGRTINQIMEGFLNFVQM